MSEVYITEPPLRGKVVLHTTQGDIDIELWAKECPKACRNFIQLCVNNYYNKTIFHRIIKDFIVQGGDPTGTGDGGQSIYDDDFPVETHSRLKFRYRGLVGVATGQDGTAGSQFFMTLGRADFLNGKHTLFGKLTGNSIYNLLKISEVPTDSKDFPIDPPYIISTEVLWNPFDDIRPQIQIAPSTSTEPEHKKPALEKREILSNKKAQLLSFEEEEDNEPTHFKHKSAHDLLDDPTLSKEEVDYSHYIKKRDTHTHTHTNIIKPTLKEDEINTQKDEIPAPPPLSETHTHTPPPEDYTEPSQNVLSFKKGQGSLNKSKIDLEHVQDSDLLTEAEKKYHLRIRNKRDLNKQKREEETFSKFLDFNQRLKRISTQKPKIEATTNEISRDTYLPDLDEVIDESDGTWLLGDGLKFAVDSQRAYDLDEAKESKMPQDKPKSFGAKGRKGGIKKLAY